MLMVQKRLAQKNVWTVRPAILLTRHLGTALGGRFGVAVPDNRYTRSWNER